jgi:hypothetical protein
MPRVLFRPARVSKQSPHLAIQELAVRPEPKLADIATALAALNENIHALSQQLDHLENDTVHNVSNYIRQCAQFICDDLTSNFKEIREDRQWYHATLTQSIQAQRSRAE